jgi:hypothetical protein
MSLSITDTQHNNALHYSECHCAQHHVLFIVVLSAILMGIIILNVVMLSIVAPTKHINCSLFKSFMIIEQEKSDKTLYILSMMSILLQYWPKDLISMKFTHTVQFLFIKLSYTVSHTTKECQAAKGNQTCSCFKIQLTSVNIFCSCKYPVGYLTHLATPP